MAGNPMTTLEAYNKHPLSRFLNERFCSKGNEATVTGMGELTGRWNVSDEDYPQFLDLLHDYLFVKLQRPLGFVEQPRLNAPKPLLIDLDFHYSKTNALVRRFTEENIREFCARVAQAYEHFFDMSVYNTLRFFVTLRPQPYADKDKIKDGIHILCPDAPLSNEKWNVIRKYLLSNNVIADIFGPTSYLNKDEDVFDPSMGRKQGWMFYGASKPSVPAYNLTNVFEYTPDSQFWEDLDVTDFQPKQLLKLMSVRYKIQDDINEVKEDVEQEYYELANPSRYTPTEPVNAFQQAAAGLMAANDPTLNALNTLVNIYANPEATNIVRRLVLECLSEDRAENHDSWMRVGWCLHNIAHTDEMFHLWMEFTEIKCPHKWNHHRAREVHQLKRNWDTGMRMDGDGPRLTERSLHKWARDDNPQVYTRVIDEDTAAYIHNTTDATHYHIALLMQKMYGSTYIASVHAKDTDWHHYDEVLNMWRPLNQGMELRQKICVEVANQIQKASLQAAQKNLATTDIAMKEFYAKKQKMLVGMQEKLYNFGFGTSVMNMCSQIFCEPDFEQKLNVDPFLFGCANGVLELRSKYAVDPPTNASDRSGFAGLVNQLTPTNANPVHRSSQIMRERVIFRQGRPEDYVSFLAGKNHPETEAINYIPYSEFVKNKDPRLDEIQDFFTKLFPREDLKKHVLKLLASCLEGMNREQLYYFFIGVGSNGKSKLITLMKYVFGDYQTSLQSTVFTRKRPESGAANPDIMAIKCRRFIYSQEPDDKEPLNTSRMKQMSGEDMLEARAMYRDQEKFKVMGKMFMMCNRLPPINSMDNGTWRRIRVIPFESRFEETDHPDLIAKKPNMYPRDNNLDDKLLTWREPFLSYLVHLYETEYIPNGLKPEPSVVKQESEKYKADHDAFAKFRCERIKELRDGYAEVTNEKVTLKEIVKAYNRWMMATGSKKMDSKELENRCEEAFGDSRGKREYSHIRVFLDEEDLEEFEKMHDENTADA